MSTRAETQPEVKVSYGTIPAKVDFLAEKIHTFHLFVKVKQKEKKYFH